MRFDLQNGELLVWAGPYAPFFGSEELALLGSLAAMVGIALDRVRLFEQEHAARIELERANQVKTNFVALAAHELRTPVTTIHGFVQTLHHLGHRLSEDEREELRRALEQQTVRMALLVEQLLDLSRLDADAIEIHPQPLKVRERVEEIVRGAAGERAGSVQVDVPEELEASVDANAFERIVSNLVVNAFRYGRPPVVVRAEQTDHHFRVAVEDHGDGVAPEFVPDLFERFSRSERSRAIAGGTGLGLAIARAYARAHDGDLIYENAEPHGARFNLVLPNNPVAA
jgi:signal transduction histidine kinase